MSQLQHIKFGRKPITGKWDNLNWTKDIMTSSMKILTRTHVRVVTPTGTWIVRMLDNGRKFMCTKVGKFMMNGYEDMNDEVKSQNGA